MRFKAFHCSAKLSEFRGILYLICAQLGLPEPKFINVSTVKKWATGDGKADKNKWKKTIFFQTTEKIHGDGKDIFLDLYLSSNRIYDIVLMSKTNVFKTKTGGKHSEGR